MAEFEYLFDVPGGESDAAADPGVRDAAVAGRLLDSGCCPAEKRRGLGWRVGDTRLWWAFCKREAARPFRLSAWPECHPAGNHVAAARPDIERPWECSAAIAAKPHEPPSPAVAKSQDGARARWLREQRAQLYVDLLTEAYAEQQHFEYTTADDESRERMREYFVDLRLPPLERARLGARGTIFASRAVNQAFNRLGREGFWALLKSRGMRASAS